MTFRFSDLDIEDKRVVEAFKQLQLELSLIEERLDSLGVITATTAQLEDVSHAINTSAQKEEGFKVFNTTTNIPVWAAGNADADVWVDSAGATDHTPV